jgi:hypothetical protein
MISRMYKILFILVIVVTSCSQEAKNEINNDIQSGSTNEIDTVITKKLEIEKNSSDNSELAQAWLEKAILEYFNQEINDRGSITTKDYDEYKGDMINSVYSHGLDLDALKEKWTHKYDVSANNSGVGFLIGAQDYLTIIIKSCTLVASPNKGELLFNLVLCDTGYDECYESDITVVPYNGLFAIDNVKEYFR